MKSCGVDGCLDKHWATGLCRRHYKQRNRARWSNGDPERRKARQRARTHERKAVGRYGDVTPEYERELRGSAHRCPLCDVSLVDAPYLPASKELDHMIPLNVGGTHTIGNVRIICRACNASRPKDGSDYTGPVTLWATQPGVVLRRQRGVCACGSRRRNGRCHTCQPARPSRRDDGARAAELRALGWRWRDIAPVVGFSRPSSCQAAAEKYGAPEVRAQWPSRYAHGRDADCVDCGDPTARGHDRCAECLEEISDSSAA